MVKRLCSHNCFFFMGQAGAASLFHDRGRALVPQIFAQQAYAAIILLIAR